MPRMASVTFDTLKFVKTLQSAGMSADQAEAVAVAVRESHESAELATKGDIAAVQKDIAALELSLKAQMNEALYALTWKLIGVAGALVAAVYFIARTVR
jgi:hypothetical protein